MGRKEEASNNWAYTYFLLVVASRGEKKGHKKSKKKKSKRFTNVPKDTDLFLILLVFNLFIFIYCKTVIKASLMSVMPQSCSFLLLDRLTNCG